MTLRALSQAAQHYAEAIEKLRTADDKENEARRALISAESNLKYYKEEAEKARAVLDAEQAPVDGDAP